MGSDVDESPVDRHVATLLAETAGEFLTKRSRKLTD